MICVISISHETIIDIALLYAIILTVVGKKKNYEICYVSRLILFIREKEKLGFNQF